MSLQEAPDSIDVTDIQFKVHSKYQLFNINGNTSNNNGVDLLATASTFGLVIVGVPSTSEIQVLRLKDVIENKETSSISARSINIPGEPYALALSCDHTMLSVCYTVNGMSFMDIYAVQTFLSNNVACVLSKVSLSNSGGVKVKQILWNPVIPNTMAICLSDGALGAYVIKPNSFEYNSLDKSENARCACWSPKGKQIVVAFPNGKLAQYKPDLKLAKTIPCSVQLFSTPFSPVAVQWLSTYQFAVVFVEEKEDAVQALFIVNAPKTTPPTYINYFDITYSQSGPRAPQVFLIHILQWNLLLMASSNSTEIGVLGTIESGETPTWKQYIFIDEGRAELPLTADKQDTFPIGLALETGCTHHLTIGENQIPVMPMLHILSTHGFILSFNLLNLQPTRVDICSPPQNLPDQSGLNLFRQITVDMRAPAAIRQSTPPQQPIASKNPPANDFQQMSNLTFSIPETGATSTPAKPPQMQSKLGFGLPAANTQPAKPAMTNLFGGTPTSGFGSSSFILGGSKEAAAKPFATQQQPVQTSAPASVSTTPQNSTANILKSSSESSQPFLTVTPNYKPSSQPTKTSTASIASNSENDAILRKLIKEEIEAFDEEIRAALNRSRRVQINVCGKEELSKLIKSIDEMQEITTQATESTESIKADVQSLRLTLYEMHAMLAEAQSKVDEFKKMGKSAEESLAVNQTHRRLVNKLQNLLQQNQTRFDVFSKQLDANWNSHLQNKKENDKARMRIPTLENVYQTLEKQHQILLKEKEKINKLKARVGVRDSSPNKIKYSYSNTDNLKVNSLIDSVLSLTIGDQIKNERRTLNSNKLESLRKLTLGSRQVNFIKPSRPDRKGLNSEVIIEKKIAQAKEKKEKENLKKAEAEIERAKQEKMKQEESAKQKELTKPKPLLPTPQPQAVNSMPLLQKPKETAEKQMNVSKSSAAVPAVNTLSKSFFGTDKPQSQPQSPFGIAPEKQAAEPVVSAAGTTAIGFPFGAKTDTSNVFGSSKSTGFSFGAPSKTASFGLTTQSKPDALNLSKPTTISTTTAVELKSTGLLVTPTATHREPLLPTPVSAAGINVTPKPSTPVAKPTAPLTTSSTQNFQPQKQPLLSTPTVPPVSASSAFKFDLGNTMGFADKPKNDKENSPVPTSVPITKASSIGGFSFSLGASTASTPAAKPTTVQTSAAMPLSSAPGSATLSTPVSAPVSTSAPASKSSSVGFSFAKASAESSLFGGSTATTGAVTTTSSPAVSSSTDPSNIFQGFNICKPNVADNSNAPKTNLFGSSPFGSLGGNAASPTSTASIFGGATVSVAATQSPSTSAPTNIFGGKPITTSASNVPTTSTTTGFGVTSPDTSVSQPTSTIFGAKTADSASLSFANFGLASTPASSAASPTASPGNLFGAAAAKPAQSIFGGAATGNNSTTSTTSIFGGASPASPPSNSFGSNVFGSANSNTSTNIFGGGNAVTSTNNTTSPTQNTGSIFGGGASSPVSGGTMFGGSTSFSSPQQQTTGSVFGGTAATGFGATQTSNVATSAPAFGGSFTQATSNAPAFGATSAFGSPFGQAAQPAQTGFGSPQQQQSSGFGLGAIAASANPTFGSGATFGTGATFGSPKGFGTFASMNQPNASFNTTPQKNSLFESLGSSENTMTFGNLAQNQNAAAAPKQFSGGSSFSSWR